MDTNLLHPVPPTNKTFNKECQRLPLRETSKPRLPFMLLRRLSEAASTMFNKEDKKQSICTFRHNRFFLVERAPEIGGAS